MKNNSWVPFRNTIIGYVNNDNFSKQQQIKLINQRNEQRKQQELIKNVHLMTKNKDKDSDDCKQQRVVSMNDLLNGYQPKMMNNLNSLRDEDEMESDVDSDEIAVDKVHIHKSLQQSHQKVDYSKNM